MINEIYNSTTNWIELKSLSFMDLFLELTVKFFMISVPIIVITLLLFFFKLSFQKYNIGLKEKVEKEFELIRFCFKTLIPISFLFFVLFGASSLQKHNENHNNMATAVNKAEYALFENKLSFTQKEELNKAINEFLLNTDKLSKVEIASILEEAEEFKLSSYNESDYQLHYDHNVAHLYFTSSK